MVARYRISRIRISTLFRAVLAEWPEGAIVVECLPAFAIYIGTTRYADLGSSGSPFQSVNTPTAAQVVQDGAAPSLTRRLTLESATV